MKEETRLLLRPTWSTASDRKVIRDAAKARLLQERGYDEATGGTKFISSPTPRKPLGGGNVQTINNGNNGRGNQPGGNNNGGNQPGGKGGNQPGGNQPGGKGGNNNVGGKTGGPTGGNPGGAPTGGGNTGGGNNQGGRGPVAPLPKQ